MEVIQMEIEVPLNFRLHKMKTLIFSLELHFYDEVYKHLTLPKDFADYFLKNEAKLYVAVENR